MTDSAIHVYDFTLMSEVLSVESLKLLLDDKCKKWTFQLELSKKGYEHYQGRISLKVRARLNQAIKLLAQPKMHLSPTSTENRDNMFYVIKDDTRIAGPWTSDDKYIPRWVSNETVEWYKWQADVWSICEGLPNTRTVNCLVDTIGCTGKTFFSTWHCVRRDAVDIPMMNDTRDMMRAVMDLPKHRVYFFDLTRSTDVKFVSNFIGAVEMLKNGRAYDDRYGFRQEYFDPPHVWIFCNAVPKPSLLSSDRWAFWTIKRNKLRPLNIEN